VAKVKRIKRLVSLVGDVVGLLLLSACSGHKPASQTAALTVSVGVYGGPLNPNTGTEANIGTPIPNTKVTVTDSAGRTVMTTTGSNGLATLPLIPGRYTVSSELCGSGGTAQPVTLSTTSSTRYQVVCPIP
jgi:phosphatidate phosphatase APP1